ncbi:MAG: Druantia anti-phage system protein DruA [Acidobacteriota bacterium]
MAGGEGPRLSQCGREITDSDVEHLKAVVAGFPRLSRKELALTLCEHWGWVAGTGAHKVTACMRLLEKLEKAGVVRLPEKQAQSGGKRWRSPELTEGTREQRVISGDLCELGRVRLDLTGSRAETELCNEYIERYHYLKYKKPFGCVLRYMAVSEKGLVGCVLMAGAAKSIRARDTWIGWSERQRLRNLPWVIGNSRFLILPWIQVKHLASHVLGQLARQVAEDWEGRWGYRPVLMETFVDPALYGGTCYRAAGWICLGYTSGRGLTRPGRRYKSTRKIIYVRPLVRDFRQQLCWEELKGRVIE